MTATDDPSGRQTAERANRLLAVAPLQTNAPAAVEPQHVDVLVQFRVAGDQERANLIAQRFALELLTIPGVAAVVTAVRDVDG